MSSAVIKVMFLDSSTNWDGACQWSIETALALRDFSIDVTIGGTPGSRLEQRAQKAGLEFFGYSRRGWSFPIASAQLSKYLSQQGFDVVVLNRTEDLVTASLACAFSGTSLVQRFGLSRALSHNPVHRLIYRFQAARLVGNCAAVVHRLREEAGTLPEAKFRTINNGVREARFSTSNRSATRLNLGLAEEEFAVGFLGCLEPMKGLHNLMGAWRIVAKRCPAARLFLAGEGELVARIKDECSRFGLEDSVRLLGFTEDADSFLQALDLFVMPSTQDEGCSHAVLEAMSHRLPIIVTNCGGLPELIESGRSGRVAPKNHADSLADAIVELHQNPMLRQSMAERAHSTVLAEFTLTKSADAWDRLFRELISTPGAEGTLIPTPT